MCLNIRWDREYTLKETKQGPDCGRTSVLAARVMAKRARDDLLRPEVLLLYSYIRSSAELINNKNK